MVYEQQFPLQSDTDTVARTKSRLAVERVALAGLLLLAAVLRLANLHASDWGNAYYAAAVRSMLISGSNFFFGAFDPAGFVTVDKPPVALWLQGISVLLFGYNGVALVLPQALLGVAGVYLLYRIVRDPFGETVALLAALFLAINPISVVMDRSNNPDSLMLFLLLAAALNTVRYTQTGRLPALLVAAFAVGLAFNTKMLAAFVLLPTLLLLVLLAARTDWHKRIIHLAATAAVLIVASLFWPAIVDSTPKAQRPYIGGSRNNTAFDLIVGYNGLGRINGESGAPGGMPPMSGGMPMGGMMGVAFGGAPGILRLTQHGIGDQTLWLLPLGIVGLFAGLKRSSLKLPLGDDGTQILLWTGWLLTYGVVFSFARGIFHPYYVSALAPPIAALAAIALVHLSQAVRSGSLGGLLLPLGLLLNGAWQGYLLAGWRFGDSVLVPIIVAGVLLAAMTLLAALFLAKGVRRAHITTWATGGALTLLLIAPTMWSIGSVRAPVNGIMPSATPDSTMQMGMGMPMNGMGQSKEDRAALLTFLKKNRPAGSILLVTGSSMSASPYIIHDGAKVITLGGFMGSDTVLTVEQFRQAVNNGRFRYVMIDGMAMMRSEGNRAIFEWVREHGHPVAESRWKSSVSTTDTDKSATSDGDFPGMGMMGGGDLYDCAPQTAQVSQQ